MPRAALVLYLAFLAVTFVWRGWIQYRRTGDHGFRGLSGKPGSAEWLAGRLFVLSLLAALVAPIADLAGVTRRIALLDRPALHYLGLLLGFGGFALTVAAQLQMGASWRVGVDARETTALVTHGLFRWVRNPIFSAMLLAVAGLFLMVPNATSLLALVSALAGLELHVRQVEEPHLLRTHGESYRAWARRTGRFVPGVGRLA